MEIENIVLSVLIVLIVLVVLLDLFLLISEKRKNRYAEEDTDIEIKLEDVPSTIYFSDDFKTKKPSVTIDEGHTITTIYINKEDPLIWICPNCEAENPSAKVKCCVCNYMN